EIAGLAKRFNAERPASVPAVDLSQLMQVINRIRMDGYIFVRNVMAEGSATLAALLPARIDEPLLAVSIGGHTAEMERDKEALINLLQSTIRRHFGGQAQEST